MVQYDLITSDLLWLLIFIAVMIFGGLDSGTRGSLWGDGWGTGWGSGWSGWSLGRHRDSWISDLEIRQQYKDRTATEIVTVSAGDHIEQPDDYLEQLINQGKIQEARKYRREMEKIADDMDDDSGLRKYAIYGARIAQAEKESQRTERAKLKTDTDWLGFQKESEPPKPDPEILISPPHDSKASAASPPIWKKQIGTPAIVPPPVVEAASETTHLPPRVIVQKTVAEPTEPEPAPRKKRERIEPVKPMVPTEKPPIWDHDKDEKPTPPPQKRIGPEYVPPPPPTPPPSYEKSAVIPEDFTPPPPGPVQIGKPSASIPKPSEKPAEEKEVRIDPDDYTDLIDL